MLFRSYLLYYYNIIIYYFIIILLYIILHFGLARHVRGRVAVSLLCTSRESVDVAFADVAFQECENWVFKEKALIRTRMRFAPC